MCYHSKDDFLISCNEDRDQDPDKDDDAVVAPTMIWIRIKAPTKIRKRIKTQKKIWIRIAQAPSETKI